MPLNVKSFYYNKAVKCCFLQDTIEEVEQEDIDAADFVLTGSSNTGNVTDEEEEDDEIFNHSGLHGKVSGEIEVVTRSIEPNSNYDEGKDDEEGSDGDEPPKIQKNQNKKAKDRKKEKPKWKNSHLKNPVVDEDVTSEKVSQKLLNMHPELSDKTEWEIFENFFNGIVELLVEHTNRYANRDKSKLQFTVITDEMMKFIGTKFLSGYNKRTYETDYWSKSPDLECLMVVSALSNKILAYKFLPSCC